MSSERVKYSNLHVQTSGSPPPTRACGLPATAAGCSTSSLTSWETSSYAGTSEGTHAHQLSTVSRIWTNSTRVYKYCSRYSHTAQVLVFNFEFKYEYIIVRAHAAHEHSARAAYRGLLEERAPCERWRLRGVALTALHRGRQTHPRRQALLRVLQALQVAHQPERIWYLSAKFNDSTVIEFALKYNARSANVLVQLYYQKEKLCRGD